MSMAVDATSSFHFACLLIVVVCDAANACALFKDTIGVTIPSEDIILKNGSTLTIGCSLHPNNFPSYLPKSVDSSNILFRKDGREIDENLVEVVDRTTARLVVPIVSPNDTGFYECYVRVPSDKSMGEEGTSAYVCGNVVKIGFQPIVVRDEDFVCISRNWQNLTCDWTKPTNDVPTTYSLSYYFPLSGGRRSRRFKCPKYRNETSCFFGLDVAKHGAAYKQSSPYYVFMLSGVNTLGRSSKLYVFKHFSSVLPDRPKDFRTAYVGKTQVVLRWMSPLESDLFPPGLQYELRYRPSGQKLPWIVKKADGKRAELSGLNPFTKYEFAIRCKSKDAVDERQWWSHFAKIYLKTRSDVVRVEPKVTSGLFEYKLNEPSSKSPNEPRKRTVTVYWQPIPPDQRNGPNFTHSVDYSPSDNRPVVPSQKTEFSAKFEDLRADLTYVFRIRPQNEEGVDPGIYSMIVVPKLSSDSKKETAFEANIYANGSYHLSWPPNEEAGTGNGSRTTVYWCRSVSGKTCNGAPSWKAVQSGSNEATVNVGDAPLRFAISTETMINRQLISSGMTWASCFRRPNEGGGANMVSVSVVPESSESLTVNWKTECEDAVGYEVLYCLADDERKCSAKEMKNLSKIKSVVLRDLLPHSWYKVWVVSSSSRSRVGTSRPIFVRTLQGVPSIVDRLIVSGYTNDTIRLRWSKPNMTNGIVTRYKINYGQRQITTTDPSSTSWTLVKGIEPFTTYEISVEACTATGCSKKSRPTFVTTDIGSPNPIEPPQFKRFNATHVEVYWSKPEKPNGEANVIQFLAFESKEEGDFEVLENLTSFRWFNQTFMEVECGRRIYAKVRAANVARGDGRIVYGEWSKAAQLMECRDRQSVLVVDPDSTTSFVVGATFGGTISLVAIFISSYSFAKWAKRKMNEASDVNIRLPTGLSLSKQTKSNIPDECHNSFINVWNYEDGRQKSLKLKTLPDPSIMKLRKEEDGVADDRIDIEDDDDVEKTNNVGGVKTSVENTTSYYFGSNFATGDTSLSRYVRYGLSNSCADLPTDSLFTFKPRLALKSLQDLEARHFSVDSPYSKFGISVQTTNLSTDAKSSVRLPYVVVGTMQVDYCKEGGKNDDNVFVCDDSNAETEDDEESSPSLRSYFKSPPIRNVSRDSGVSIGSPTIEIAPTSSVDIRPRNDHYIPFGNFYSPTEVVLISSAHRQQLMV